ncbi:MAG: rRNA (guanosine2251-2-O)-methyltransferase [Halanaerobiales bacterium]|nr:rRNA (guanosine2251-2-O)-methyltransferase [Halanaerobiales bacterium]
MAKIEGRNPVIEALKGKRRLERILIQQGIGGNKIDWIIDQARKKGIKVERLAKKKLDQMALSHAHQGVIALGEPVKIASPQEMIELAAERDEAPFIIILDQIQDPHNFGSIIRTAYAAGAHGIIFQKRRAAGITPVVVKSSAGAIEHLMLAEVTNINYTIDELKEAGLWIAGADMEGEELYFQADLKGPIGIVIGSEGAGLRHLVKEKCDFLLKIPMKGILGSLNASVAAAIIIYEVVRQRA